MTNFKASIQPLDRVAIALMLVLCFVIGVMILQGDVVTSRVRDFTWQHQETETKDLSLTNSNWENQKIGAEYNRFALSFSRPMDTKSVEQNLKIDPPLAGKFSWAGRKMFYTLLTPAPYGTTYKVQLQGAKDKFAFAEKEPKKRTNAPFVGNFRTRDRVMLYIGADKEEKGRLVLYNLTQDQNKILTPKDLVVMDYKPFPEGEKIIFSARTSSNQDLLSAQLYTVTTGISLQQEKQAEPAGKVDLILDNKDFQNLKFDISQDGQTIAIQRGNRASPGDFGLWFMPANTKPGEKPNLKRVQSPPGGDFTITPDSQSVAVAQGEGTAILPLKTDSSKPLAFFPQFGLVQAFSKDGSQAAMVKFNKDYTRDLFLVTNQGVNKLLLKTTGSIVQCQFDTASPTLYCLVTQLLQGGELYQEQPYLVAIDIKTGQQKPLLVLPPAQRNVEMSLAPDGLGLLFDQVVPEDPNTPPSPGNTLRSDDGEAIATSSLWLMPLLPITDAGTTAEIKPEQLPLIGFHPSWLP
ncbi:MAG: hypothetical protein KME38_08195 [Spirirestis rafaelensis WJT71-NPBG6]|nr:hypothetical protein [Spirirestis rafaelensis WJT71-NPBG6]